MASTVQTLCGLNKTSGNLLTDAGVTSSAAELNLLDDRTTTETVLPFATGKMTTAAGSYWTIGAITQTSFLRPCTADNVSDGYLMPYAGSITSMTFRLNKALSKKGYRVTCAPYKCSTNTGPTGLNGTQTIQSTSGQAAYVQWTKGTKTFAAGDRVGLKVVVGTTKLAGATDFYFFATLGVVY